MTPFTFTLPDDVLDEIARRVALIIESQAHPATPARWLSVDEAADYLRCSKQRVYDLRSSGRLGRYGDGGRALVDRHELDQLVHDGRS